jgi:hypothetical protein
MAAEMTMVSNGTQLLFPVVGAFEKTHVDKETWDLEWETTSHLL